MSVCVGSRRNISHLSISLRGELIIARRVKAISVQMSMGSGTPQNSVHVVVMYKDKPTPSCVHSLSETPREVTRRFCLNKDLSNGIL